MHGCSAIRHRDAQRNPRLHEATTGRRDSRGVRSQRGSCTSAWCDLSSSIDPFFSLLWRLLIRNFVGDAEQTAPAAPGIVKLPRPGRENPL
jgi:hypothetical protein